MQRALVSAAIASLITLSACAERYLDEEETVVTQRNIVTPESDLKAQGAYSQQLSRAYVEAGKRAQKGQDAAAIATFLAAGAFVSGAVGSASDVALANTAVVGAGSTAVASRTVSQNSIKGIYVAARRMNCISTTANSGRFLLSQSSSNTKYFARAATHGAINDVRVLVREGLVRKVEDFGALKTSFTNAVDPGGLRAANEAAGIAQQRGEKTGGVDIVVLNQYLGLLDQCLAKPEDLKAGTKVPKEDT